MTKNNLEIIKNRTLVLKNGENSGDLLLADSVGGDMFISFEIRYVSEDRSLRTQVTSSDSHHACIIIETRPNAISRPNQLIELGTYGNGRPLYVDVIVQPQISVSGEHNVVITFYAGKEGANGN